jgi:D-arabinose 1-dehydrogenase-like Zn-dependent alcohol dehydrogenase
MHWKRNQCCCRLYWRGEHNNDAVRILNRAGVLILADICGNGLRIPSVRLYSMNTTTALFTLGKYNELCDIIEIANRGKTSYNIYEFALSEINSLVDMLRIGQINSKVVIIPE